MNMSDRGDMDDLWDLFDSLPKHDDGTIKRTSITALNGLLLLLFPAAKNFCVELKSDKCLFDFHLNCSRLSLN